jgi:tetratricopeptide (TPR) repeat protein
MYYAHLLMILRRPDEAIEQAEIGLMLDPSKYLVLGLHGVVMTFIGNYEAAIRSHQKALSLNPSFVFSQGNLLLPYYFSGEYDKWLEAWMKKVRWSDDAKSSVKSAFNRGGKQAAIEEMFRLNSLYAPDDCFMSDGVKATRYLHLGDLDKAMDHIELQYERVDIDAAYVTVDWQYDLLKNHPRYQALLEKMEYPLPFE